MQCLSGAFVDIAAVDDSGLRIQPLLPRRPRDTIRDHGRSRARPDRQRVKDVVLAFVDQLAVAIDVHQIEYELAAAICRHQKILLAQRIRRVVGGVLAAGVVSRRFDRIDGPVARLGPVQLGGDFRQAVGKVETLVGIDDPHRAAEPVVMGAAGEHHSPAAGNAAGVLEQVGPDALVAP